MNLSLATRPGRDCVVVRASGELDLATDEHLRRILQQALDAGVPIVLLDLTRVRFLDSTALGAIVWLRDELQKRGGHVRVAVSQPFIVKILELTSVDRLVRVYDTVEAAESDLPTDVQHR